MLHFDCSLNKLLLYLIRFENAKVKNSYKSYRIIIIFSFNLLVASEMKATIYSWLLITSKFVYKL